MNRTAKLMMGILTMAIFVASIQVLAAGEPTGAKDVTVNINTATAVELAYLPGVGPSTAERIIKYRKSRPFKQPHHLMRVKGIGRKTLKKIKPFITISGQTTAERKIKLARK